MSNTEGAQPAPAPFSRELVAAAPVIWLCASLLLAARGLWQGWPLVFGYGLPSPVVVYLQASMAAAVVQVLLGLYVLGLAWRRSPTFPGWFTGWAVLAIVVDLGFQTATLFIEPFVPSLMPWLVAGISVALSLWTIALVRRQRPAGPAPLASPAPPGVVVLNAALGLVIGGAVGLGVGLLAGSVIVDWLDVSCFEGGCGYAAAAIGLLGLLIGAIGGPIFAIVHTRRRRAPTPHAASNSRGRIDDAG